MANGKGPGGRTGVEPVDEILRDVEALTNASRRRHLLARDSREYAAALEMEEDLVARIWRLGTALPRRGRGRGTRRPTSSGPSD